jgi:hypothetical protein
MAWAAVRQCVSTLPLPCQAGLGLPQEPGDDRRQDGVAGAGGRLQESRPHRAVDPGLHDPIVPERPRRFLDGEHRLRHDLGDHQAIQR